MHLISGNRIQGFCSPCWPSFILERKKKGGKLHFQYCHVCTWTFPTLWGELWLYSVVREKGTSYRQQERTVVGKNMCFTIAVWAFCSVIWLTTKAHSRNCIPAFRMQVTKLQKADLVSFADGLWVSCGIILNYIGSQSLVLERCSELRVVMCLDHSVGKQAVKLLQLLWRAAAKGPAEQGASDTPGAAVLLGMHYAGGPATLRWAVEHFALKVRD